MSINIEVVVAVYVFVVTGVVVYISRPNMNEKTGT